MFLKITKSPILRQYMIVITVNLNLIGVGLGLAWPSPMLVKLEDSQETILDRPITELEGSRIVSTGFLVGALMNFMPALLLSRIGFKYSLLVGILPKVLGSFFTLLATDVWMLILGRALNGMSDIFIFTVVPTYAAVIANKEVRGALSIILQIMCSLGGVIMLSVGPFVSYFAANALFVSVIIASLIPIPFLPESPYYLYTKGRTKESVEVLTLLRGCEEAAKEELLEYSSPDSHETTSKLDLFKNRTFLKSLCLAGLFDIGVQLLGFNAVSFYLQSILNLTQTSVRAEIASVIIGVIQLFGSLCTAAVTDRFGRKPILITSLMGMMVGMISLGVFFYVTDGADVIDGFMNYLPLIAIIMVVFCFSAGTGSLIWTVVSELFDNSGREVGLSICLTLSGLTTFFVTRNFASLMAAIGPAATFWAFGVASLVFCVYIVVFIPETKGKTFREIQRTLGGKTEERVEIEIKPKSIT